MAINANARVVGRTEFDAPMEFTLPELSTEIGASIDTIEVGDFESLTSLGVRVNSSGDYGAFYNPSPSGGNNDFPGSPVLIIPAIAGQYEGGPGILTVGGVEYEIPAANINTASISDLAGSLTYVSNGNCIRRRFC